MAASVGDTLPSALTSLPHILFYHEFSEFTAENGSEVEEKANKILSRVIICTFRFFFLIFLRLCTITLTI